MALSAYLGHVHQTSGVEEVRLVGGKGDGMRLLQIRNGLGLEITVSCDRCADVSRVVFKGDNMGYFSPCGYVAPAYYDKEGIEFLKSFTAGFFTTCGLTNVGSPCTDEGETLPLHGTIGNTPCEQVSWEEMDDRIVVKARINASRIFDRHLVLFRTITVSKKECSFSVSDSVENQGDSVSPVMLLYHMNMGYPLLSEKSQLEINSVDVVARNEHAAKDLATWNKVLAPSAGFEEQCYYHKFKGEACAQIYNPDIRKGLKITFDSAKLDNFCEWKMMGIHDYVLGLEPGNCTADGRDVMRKNGTLKFLKPGETKDYQVNVNFFEK